MKRGSLSAAIVAAIASAVLTACTSPTPVASDAPLASTAAQPQTLPTPQAQIGAFGLDLPGGDASVKPGDNFYRYAGGTWVQNNPIPPDRTLWDTFQILASKSEIAVRDLIEDIAKQPDSSPVDRKIADYYRAFMDEAAIEAAGLKPIAQDLERMTKARTKAELLSAAADPPVLGRLPINAYVGLDPRNPDRYIAFVLHGSLGLPDREYYLTDKFAEIRTQYQVHIAKMLTLAGQTDGAAKAQRIFALETSIAKLHWTAAERRDRDRRLPKTRAELLALADGYPMQAELQAMGLDQQAEFIVREPDALPKLAALFRSTPLDQWREYMIYSCISAHAELLPKALADERFDFYGRILNGQMQQRDRSERGVEAVNLALGEAVGAAYVKRYFSAEAKAKMLDLVENVRRAYGERIDNLTWMSPQTKAAAREKLAAFGVKIGYPDRWRDYSALQVRPDDPIGNLKRFVQFEIGRRVARINQPTDRDEWNLTPQRVNAAYNVNFNEIVFPAGILQPPYFDPNADAAVNYGGIGAFIGHEMGHGFDDQGAKSDARGIQRDWWQPQDVAAFKALTGRLADQYAQFEVLPGLNLNGQLTVGENIADNGGLSVALAAYRLSLQGKPAPVLANLSGEQRFFLSWAQVFRTQISEQRLRNQVMIDPHSPAEFRVNGTVRNMPEWYEAFNVQPGQKLFLPPEQRVTIW